VELRAAWRQALSRRSNGSVSTRRCLKFHKRDQLFIAAHTFCGLAALTGRRPITGMPLWEATQMLLGLSIPYLLFVQIANTRETRILTGIDYPGAGFSNPRGRASDW